MVLAKGVTEFKSYGDRLIASTGNSVVDLVSGETLMQFRRKVQEGHLIVDANIIAAYDPWNGSKYIHNDEIFEGDYLIMRQLYNEVYLVLYMSPRHIAAVDLQGNQVWKRPHPSAFHFLVNNHLVVLDDRSDAEQQLLIGVDSRTGGQVYSIDFGSTFPYILGCAAGRLWTLDKTSNRIVAYNALDGNVIYEVPQTALDAMARDMISFSHLRYDGEKNRLVHPYGEFYVDVEEYFSYEEKEVRSRDLVAYAMAGGNRFAFTSRYTAYCYMINEGDWALCRLRVQTRSPKSTKLLQVKVNENHDNARIRQWALYGEVLFGLDTCGYLHRHELPPEFSFEEPSEYD